MKNCKLKLWMTPKCQGFFWKKFWRGGNAALRTQKWRRDAPHYVKAFWKKFWRGIFFLLGPFSSFPAASTVRETSRENHIELGDIAVWKLLERGRDAPYYVKDTPWILALKWYRQNMSLEKNVFCSMNKEKIREERIFEIVHCPFEGQAKLHHLCQPNGPVGRC